MIAPWRHALFALVLPLLGQIAHDPRSPQPAPAWKFRGEEALARVYDVILDARFDQVESELRRACGPAPHEACDVLDATAMWWRIMLDPHSRELDGEFALAAERAIRTTEAWTGRDPGNAEAWFYVGAAYATRLQWRVLRQEKLAAARDGGRIKDALEQALELEPRLDDAYFGIGLYRYYADVAPGGVRLLRFLLLLPGGNREEGLEQMLRARDRGRLLQGEADYQLHLVYLWYEQETGRALDLLGNLQRQYPGNPLFLMRTAEIQDVYLHDTTASLGTWQTLLALAREQRVNAAGIAEVRARLGIATHLETLHQTDRALEQLEAVIALQPRAPYGALALAHLQLAQAHDRLGARARALEAYHQARRHARVSDPHDVSRQAEEGIRRAPDRHVTDAYRLSLQGWRKLEQKDVPGAAADLERSIALAPRDPVARYRLGRLRQTRRDDAGALAAFEAAIAQSSACPAPILAATHLEVARLHERAGRRVEALAAYRVAATLFGGAQETRTAAERAIERLEKTQQ